jgi:iron complex outermembrane receptor protein
MCLLVVMSGLMPLASAAQGTGVLEGTVVARESGRVVANATVTIEGTDRAAVASAAGRFRLEGVPTGQVVLNVQAPGFLDLRVPNVQVSAEPSLFRVELEVTPNYLERVQVTADRSPVRIGDVGALADVIDRSTIDARGDQTLTQAIAHVPGSIMSVQLGIFDSIMLRGMPRASLEFTNTLLMIDGVPQTTSSNAARVVAMPINDASSIEVVRGPNSAVYGRTAIGGSVNLRTADPTPDHQFGVVFTGGEFEMLKGVVKASGPLRQWGGYYASAAREQHHGYFENKISDDFSAGNWALFGKMTFVPDARSFGSVSLNRVVSDNSTPTNEPIFDGRLLHEIEPRFDRFTNFNIPGTNYHQGEGRLTFNYTRQLGQIARIDEVFGYRAVQYNFIDDGDFIGSPFDVARRTVTMYPFSQQLDEDIFYQELRFELAPRTGRVGHRLTVGGSYEWNDGSLASDFIYTDEDTFGFPNINVLNPVLPPRSEWQHDTNSRVYHLGATGLFAQYMVEPAPRVMLTAAGRYDRLDMDVTRSAGAKVEDTFDAFSPKLSATFRLLGIEGDGRPTVNVYGTYSQAFLPPRRPSSLVPADVPLNLEPEDIENYEAGLKGGLLGGRVTFEAAYFWMTEDGVVLNTRQGPFFLPTNAGEQKYKGLETGMSWAATPKVSVYANAAIYRPRFGDFVIQSAGGDTVLTGNRLPISPDRIVNWGATIKPVPAIEGTLNVKHVGDVQTNNDNTFLLDPYSVVDAAVTWRRGPLRVTLSAHNLLNEEYYWNGDGEVADPGRPRQVLVTTSFLFR